MTEFSFSRRHRLVVPTLSVTAALAAALLCAGGPVAAQDAANPNVIVDDSALDGATGANNTDTELLPAPAHQPLSRLVTAGQSAIETAMPSPTTSETTFSAAPTTPIELTSLEGSDEPGAAAATAPAAGETAQGEAASTQPPASAAASGDNAATGTQTAEGKAPDAGTTATAEQTAAKPPIDGMLRLTFDPEFSVISDAAKAQLGPLVEKLTTDVLLRVQVLAYAGGDDDASSHARGISLARALAMRNYLSAQGIPMDRMDIKALGNSAQEEPADRVDLVPIAE